MSNLFRRLTIGITSILLAGIVFALAAGLLATLGWVNMAHSQANDVATPFVVTATPTPADVFDAATRSAMQTVQARNYGHPNTRAAELGIGHEYAHALAGHGHAHGRESGNRRSHGGGGNG